MRNNCANLNIQTFLEDQKYKDMNVWDLKYISTSDEEDNDSSEDEDEDSSEEEEEKKEEKSPKEKKYEGVEEEEKFENIWKKSPGKNDNVP